MKKPIIIDCDPGIDDAIALLLALASEHLDVKLITTCAGNQTLEKVTANALKLLDFFGHKEIEVAAGAQRPLFKELFLAADYHGESGLGGVELPNTSKTISDRNAVEAIKEVMIQCDEKVSIVAIGPLTNIATLIKAYPNILNKIEQISIMGGADQGGNTTPVAEFNIFVDPEAAQIVFNSGVPISMFGLDVTYKAVLFPEDIERIKKLENRVSDVIGQMLDYFARNRPNGVPMHDACAVANLIDPNLFTFLHCNVQVETKGEFTYGQTVIDKNNKTNRQENAKVAFEIERKQFIELIYEAIKSF